MRIETRHERRQKRYDAARAEFRRTGRVPEWRSLGNQLRRWQYVQVERNLGSMQDSMRETSRRGPWNQRYPVVPPQVQLPADALTAEIFNRIAEQSR